MFQTRAFVSYPSLCYISPVYIISTSPSLLLSFAWISFKGVFTWRRASPLGIGLALFAEIPRLGVKFFVKICFRLYERRASPLWRDLAIDYPRSRLGGLEIFHINALKSADPPRRASKSKLRTHDKGCLDQHFLDNFSFHKLCLFMCRL